MYHTIQEGKKAISRINRVYPFLEEIFDSRTTMTRKEIMQEYSKIEMKTTYYGRSGRFSSTQRDLPCFETLRHLGLLIVKEEKEISIYFAEGNYGEKDFISKKLYNQLPDSLREYCESVNYNRYYYSLAPKSEAIEKILSSVNHNLKSLLELVK